MRKVVFCALVIGASAFALWPAVALAGGGGLCAGFASGEALIMRDGCFEGVAHFASAGGTLMVSNEGVMPHSFTAVDGSFDTGQLAPGETAEIQLSDDGIIRVYCTLHGTADGHGMAGVLLVGDPAPEAMTAGLAADVNDTLAKRDAALLEEVEAQSQSLAELKAEVAAVKQAVEGTATGSRPVDAAVLGTLGVLLGGGALTVILSRRRAERAAKEERPV